MKMVTILASAALVLVALNASAATVDGRISDRGAEYTSNTKGAEGSLHWNTFGNDSTPDEYRDASGGKPWDIRYMGTAVENGKFHFGIQGGDIISGKATGSYWDGNQRKGLYLGDIALGINPTKNPTVDSSDFEYAIRLLSTNSQTGKAEFALLTGGDWQSVDIYNTSNGKHQSETYKMDDKATVLTTFQGAWKASSRQKNVLEGAFDMSFLASFDASLGGEIGTYLTMTCVNDEASVITSVDPVSQVPVPSALWLFSPALVGFMALGRRKKKHV